MSMQKVLVSVPSLHPVPRGAVWVSLAVSWLQGFSDEVRAIVSATAEAARKRAAAERDARSRAELVALAQRYQGTQPEFAKDLFAAANDNRAR
jgi:hypothetical protein